MPYPPIRPLHNELMCRLGEHGFGDISADAFEDPSAKWDAGDRETDPQPAAPGRHPERRPGHPLREECLTFSRHQIRSRIMVGDSYAERCRSYLVGVSFPASDRVPAHSTTKRRPSCKHEAKIHLPPNRPRCRLWTESSFRGEEIKPDSEPFLSRACAQLSSFGQPRTRKSNLSATEANLTRLETQGTLRFDGGFRPSVSSAH